MQRSSGASVAWLMQRSERQSLIITELPLPSRVLAKLHVAGVVALNHFLRKRLCHPRAASYTQLSDKKIEAHACRPFY
jgi:hypothetical protein